MSRLAASLTGRVRWHRSDGADEGQSAVGVALRGGIPDSLLVRSDRHAVAAELWVGRMRQAFGERRRPEDPAGTPVGDQLEAAARIEGA